MRRSGGRASGDLAVSARIATFAVIPAASTIGQGTSSRSIRIGTRCASRTQVKIGLTVGSPWMPGAASATLIPRPRPVTRPRIGRSGHAISDTRAASPSPMRGSCVSSK
ncbi:hypothetical protein ACU4GR_25335 [Methylobacterium oryzae CBMB20]